MSEQNVNECPFRCDVLGHCDPCGNYCHLKPGVGDTDYLPCVDKSRCIVLSTINTYKREIDSLKSVIGGMSIEISAILKKNLQLLKLTSKT